MKFSTKGRYALRMMIEFALRPGECTKINHVAERQDISDKYLEQIVTILSRAGYVKSRRGAQGGYYLAKDTLRIHRRHDPAACGRQSGTGILYGGRNELLQQSRDVCQYAGLEETGQGHL